MAVFPQPRRGRIKGESDKSARHRALRPWGKVEALERRCLLAVTSTTPVPISVIEGFAFNGAVMDFTANDAGPFTATIVWGDLTTTAGVVSPSGGGFTVSGLHTYTEDGSYPVTVSITDTADNTTVSPTTTATVSEAVLSQSSVAISTPEGTPFNGTVATFSDPGSPDPGTDFTATIDWGDGTTPDAGTLTATGGGNFTITGTHTYPADEGSYSVTVTTFENNDPGFTISTTGTATVTEADTFTNGVITPPAGAVEGQVLPPTTQIATFSDPGFPTNDPADFTAVINWGDGSGPSPGTIVALGGGNFAVQGGHQYNEEGVNPVSILIADDAPGTATLTISGNFTIADAPLTASPVTINGTEGAPLTNVDVATFVDADPLGTAHFDYIATIDWGDGTITAGSILQDAAGTFHVQGSHTYTEENGAGYAVIVNITDNGDGRAPNDPTNSTATTTSTALIVQSPLLPVANAVVGVEGTAIPVATQVASFTDTGGADAVTDYTATVDWGDGLGPLPATVISLGNGGNFAVVLNAAHTYAEAGVYAVTVAITDADPTNPNGVPTTAQVTSTATIADAPLFPSVFQPIIDTIESAVYPVPEFGPPVFNGPVASFNDVNPMALTTDFTVTIDWGDGTPQSAGTVSQFGGLGLPFSVTGSHTYAEAGINGGTGLYPVTVYVTDVDGSKLILHPLANVVDRTIDLTGQLNPASDTGVSNSDAITNIRQPNFFGTSEPFSHVTLFATATGSGLAVPIGQLQADSHGYWNITSSVALADGTYSITASAVDQFGVTTTLAPVTITPNLVIDTVGPVITGAFFNRLNGEVDYTIQDPSPASNVNVATLLDSSNYLFTKVQANRTFPGQFIVTNINANPGAAPDSYDVAVTFNNGASIRGGFYLFTIRNASNGNSSVQDVAGNHLDGVFYGTFPSGNGIPGSDFVAEIDGFHNRIFAPQTLVGTANSANGGVGGSRVGAVHGGRFTPVVPRGFQPITTGLRSAGVRHATVVSHPAGVQHAAVANHPRGPLHHR